MKVALLTDGIHPFVIGGIQRHSYYLCKYLAANGVQVDLYHTGMGNTDALLEGDELFTSAERQNIRFISVQWPPRRHFPGHYVWESYWYAERIFRHLISDAPPDVIYAKGYTAWYLLQKKFTVPILVNFHGAEFLQPAFSFRGIVSNFILRQAGIYSLRKAHHIISYGGGITKLMQKYLPLQQSFIEIPAAIPFSWINETTLLADKVIRFCFVGRDERRKALPELTKVIKKFVGHENFEFHFVGDLRKIRKIEASNVYYHGLMADSDALKQILYKMDVLVCPSFSEGMPNVILEAMASGCTVIATDVGAISTVVTDDSGWLFEAGDFVRLEKIIYDILKNGGGFLLEKRERARERIKRHFVWEKIIQSTIKELQTVISLTPKEVA
jgi:glycosyltransferase involved in cell wall biosynthesis